MVSAKALHSWIVGVIAAVISASVQPVKSQAQDTNVQAADRARNDEDSYIKWSQSWSRCTEEEVGELMSHKNDMIAVMAAWKKFVALDANRSSGTETRVGVRRASQFVAFVEGRLRVGISDWYEGALSEGMFVRGRGPYMLPSIAKSLTPEREVAELIFTRSPDVRKAKEGIEFVSEGVRLMLHNRKFKGIGNPHRVVFAESNRRFLIAYHPIGGGKYKLDNYDIQGKVEWEAVVWAAIERIGVSTAPVHEVEVLHGDENVYVVGITEGGPYIEGFRVENGEPVMRWVTDMKLGRE